MVKAPEAMVQYCIDAQYFEETLRAIPTEVVILNVTFRTGRWGSSKRVEIAVGDNTAVFVRTKKEIHPDETDQRKKLTVLGLTSSEGNIVTILRALSAKKYSCKIEIIPTKRIMCGEVR
jgi:hypothetical protein